MKALAYGRAILLIAIAMLLFTGSPRFIATHSISAATPNPYPTALPTITPQPVLPATVTEPYIMADTIADGIGVDTSISQNAAGGSPTSDYGFTTQVAGICGSAFYGSFGCIRHIRDGKLAPYNATHDADLNLLATKFGVDALTAISSGDTAAQISQGLVNRTGLCCVDPDNEIDSAIFNAFLTQNTAVNATTATVNTSGNYSQVGATVTVGEGPSQDTATIASYTGTSSFTGSTIAFTAGLAHAHAGNMYTNLTANVTAGSPSGVAPFTVVGATPFPNYPGTAPAPSAVTSISLANRSGISPNDYLTVGCQSVNAARNANTEVVQVASSYTATTGSGSVPLTSGLLYSHGTYEKVVKGCIERAPGNFWGAMLDEGAEITRLKSLVPSSIPVLNITTASTSNQNAFSPQYGGLRVPYAAFDITQQHDYCGLSCSGNYGDGTLGFGGTHPYCEGLNCLYSSWQYQMSLGWTEGGNLKPYWCTECGWYTVPIGSPANSYVPGNVGSNFQIPEDIPWNTTQVLWQLTHGTQRVYTFQLTNDAGGFCTLGLEYTTACGGTAGFGIASGVRPKASYKGLTDLIGLMTDTNCRYPGCTFTPDPITWAWGSLPASHHGSGNTGTDPDQLQLAHFEYANGSVLLAYYYASLDYNQQVNAPAQGSTPNCASTTSCYQWCNNPANTQTGASLPVCFTTNLYVQGAHSWGSCQNIDTDITSTNYTFGHIIPTSTVTFNASDQIPLSVRPELQFLLCTGAPFSPTTVGTALAKPTPIPNPAATPEALPVFAAVTPVPKGFLAVAPTPPPSALTVSPTTMTFASATAAAQTATLADPPYTGTYSVTASVPGIVTSAISGKTLSVSPVTSGSTVLTINDGNTTATLSVTVTGSGTGPPLTVALAQPCASAQQSINGTGLTATLANPVSVGDTLIAAYSSNNPALQAFTAPAGQSWTQQANVPTSTATLLNVWSATAATTTQTFTFSQFIAASSSALVCEYTNVGSIQSIATSVQNGLLAPLGVITPTVTGALPISLFAFDHYPYTAPQRGWATSKYIGAPYRYSLELQTGPKATLSGVSGSVLTGSSANISGALLVLDPALSTSAASVEPSVFDAVSSSVSSGPLSLAWPRGSPPVGTLLLGCTETQFGDTPATPAGWTALYSAADAGGFGTGLFYRFAGTSEPGFVSWALTSGNPSNIEATMVGVANSSPAAPQWSESSVNAPTMISTAAITPAALNSLPLACFAGANVSALTTAAGWSVAASALNGYFSGLVQSRNTASNGTDAVNGISVASTVTGSSGAVTAFGLVVAPLPTPTAPVVTPPPPPPPPPPPIYAVGTPGPLAAYPITIAPPVASQITVGATFTCATNATGSTILDSVGGWVLASGLCNNATNPTDATGLHFYNATSGFQAVPAMGLHPGTTYRMFGTHDATTTALTVCAYPQVACSHTSVADSTALATGSTAYIGAGGPTTRLATGDIWDAEVYDYALSLSSMQAEANAMRLDPYPAPIQTPPPVLLPADYYVAVNGSDLNPGSGTAPFATIQKAANVATAGKVVDIEPGTYAPTPDAGGYLVDTVNSGTSGSPIVYEANTPGTVILDGRSNMGAYCWGFENGTGSFISVSGIEVKGCSSGGFWLNNANANITLSHVTVDNIGRVTNDCSTTGRAGIYIGFGASNITVDRALIHDVGRIAPVCTTGSANLPYTNDHGIYMHGNNITVTNSIFYNYTSGWAIQLVGSSTTNSGFTIANNTFGVGNKTTTGYSYAPGAIVIDSVDGGGVAPTNITIENNVMRDLSESTFIDTACCYTNIPSLVARNNDYTGASGVALFNSSATYTGSGNITTNPLFNNEATFDYHPQASTPLFAAGYAFGLVDDFDNNKRPTIPTIGALEYLGSTAPPVYDYTNATPGQTYPLNITLPASTGSMTILATIKCNTTTTGATIISLLNSWSLEAGLCQNTPNPQDGTGAHLYDFANNVQAAPSAGLIPTTNYTIAGRLDTVAQTLDYIVCPNTGTCVKTSVPDTGTFAAGSSAIIGASAGNSRVFSGDIWNVSRSLSALSDSAVQAYANAAPDDPYPPIKPPPPPPVLNFTPPYPNWPNALAITQQIIAPGASSSDAEWNNVFNNHLKSYNTGAINGYTNYSPNWTDQGFGKLGGTPRWNGTDDWLPISSTGGGYLGTGFTIAAKNDPVYKFQCLPLYTLVNGKKNYSGGGYCGALAGVTNILIPDGARTQNSGKGACDCHFYVVEPVGWVPISSMGYNFPDVSPNQYEIDTENAGNSMSCINNSSTACTTFNGGGVLAAGDGAIFSTGSTGFYGAYSRNNVNDGFSPANTGPTFDPNKDSYVGPAAADKSDTPYTDFVVSAGDIAQGAINHETALAMVCAEPSQSDEWPGSPQSGTDYSCHDPGVDGYHWDLHFTGFYYGDHLLLKKSDADIAADQARGFLTPLQAILARSFAHYGALYFDNIGPYNGNSSRNGNAVGASGPTYNLFNDAGNPQWDAVLSGPPFNLKKITTSVYYSGNTYQQTGYMFNLTLPQSYMDALYAVDACVVPGAPNECR